MTTHHADPPNMFHETRDESDSFSGRILAAGQTGFNRVLAVILVVASAPLMLVLALVVKLESPRAPIIYRQERVGLNRRREPKRGLLLERRRDGGEGKPFTIWKFRTMVPEAEAHTGPVWATENDPRITTVGRILRATRLDELPQLFNVVRGEMFLVGPRPERPHFVSRLAERVPDYRRRLNVPPGITGLAQVEREYDGDLDDVRTKLRYDLHYIENRKPSMDFKILIKTLSVIFFRRGAR